jgi:hypothetical protein
MPVPARGFFFIYTYIFFADRSFALYTLLDANVYLIFCCKYNQASRFSIVI